MTAALLELTATVVSGYVSQNTLPAADLPNLIATVYQSLQAPGSADAPEQADTGPLKPAVSVRKSVMPDYIVCLEDGKKLKMLKRHLKTAYNMTPDEYRTKWGLPSDYPMVAPNYAKARSDMALQIGLGRRSA